MFRKSVLVILILSLFLCSCSSVNPANELKASLNSDYICNINIVDKSGAILFGGNFTHTGGAYEYAINSPESISGLKFSVSGDNLSASYEDFTLPISPSAVQKLLYITDALDTAIQSENSGNIAELHGEKCNIIDCDGFKIYFSNGIPMNIEFGDTEFTAQVTGFLLQKGQQNKNAD